MKKILALAVLLIIIFEVACSSDSDSSGSCGTYNGKQLHKGSQGGCYYLSSGGNKEYVDASYCKC